MTISRPILSQGLFSRFTEVRIILRMGVSSVAKSRASRACVFVCSTCVRALVLGVLAYLMSLRAYVLSSFACLRAGVLLCLTCLAYLRAYVLGVLMLMCFHVFSMLACFMSSRVLYACDAQISYVLTSLRASLKSFVLFSKNYYIKKFLFIQRSI